MYGYNIIPRLIQLINPNAIMVMGWPANGPAAGG